MSGATTRDQLVDIVTDALGCDASKITDETSAKALGADSLDWLEIVMTAEDRCGVDITDAEAEAVRTFGDLVALVERKRGEA